MIVAVSGGREYRDAVSLYFWLDHIHKLVDITLLIQGQCPVGDGGCDELARRWAESRQVNCLSVPPKVAKHRWPAAGPKRNEEIARMHPRLWVFFPGGAGTDNARKVAKTYSIKPFEVIA